jgi:hypothetical protein
MKSIVYGGHERPGQFFTASYPGTFYWFGVGVV